MHGEVILSGARWEIGPSLFSSPIEVHEAWDRGDVVSSIEKAQKSAERGHWVAGFVSYEAAPGLLPGVAAHKPLEDLPLAWFGVYADRRRFDSHKGAFALGAWAAGMSPEGHRSRVDAIQTAIREGTTYQVNLTFPMHTSFEGDPMGLFHAMSVSQPRSFGSLVDLGSIQILSVSPELFFRLEGNSVTAQPMKGTARRGRWQEEDEWVSRALAESEKERAGNVMIVDMIRSDLGRVARPGSVSTTDLYSIERHPTVWQMTSTVTAKVSGDVRLAEIFGATFPSGSVTGAPKKSTMAIIAAEEVAPRGVYCGAIGFIAPGALSSVFAVAIRTGTLQSGVFTYHTGGGITIDSDPRLEYQECLLKADVVARPPRRPRLLETMRYEPKTGIHLVERHMDRLAGSALYWGYTCDLVRIRDAISEVSAASAVKVRLVLDIDGSIEVGTEAVPVDDQPVQLKWANTQIDPSDPLRFHKTVDRSLYPVTDDGLEAILVNVHGQIAETNRSNLMIRLGQQWVTPPLASGCLPGVFRSWLLEEGRVVEDVVHAVDLADADELAVTNSVRGWRKAVLIE